MSDKQRPTGRLIQVQEPAKQSSEPPKKKRKTKPKVTPQVLTSKNGFTKLKEDMLKLKLQNTEGKELTNLKLIMSRYESWSTRLIPGIPFDSMIHQIETICSGVSTRVRITCKVKHKHHLTNLIDGVTDEGNPETSTALLPQDTEGSDPDFIVDLGSNSLAENSDPLPEDVLAKIEQNRRKAMEMRELSEISSSSQPVSVIS